MANQFHKDLIGDDLHIARAQAGSGSPTGVVTAGIIGEFYWDYTNNHLYVAEELTDSDWVQQADAYDQSLNTTDNVIFNGLLTTSFLSTDANHLDLNESGETDITADGGGIHLKGTSLIYIIWDNATNAWQFNQNGQFLGSMTIGALSASAADSSLDLKATDKFFSLNAVATAVRDTLSPQERDIHYDPTTKLFEGWNGSMWVNFGSGGGDVVGPASAADNLVARYDGATGKLLKSSPNFQVGDLGYTMIGGSGAPDTDTFVQIITPDSDGLKIKSPNNAQLMLHDTGAAVDLKQVNLACFDGVLHFLQVDDDLAGFSTLLTLDLATGDTEYTNTSGNIQIKVEGVSSSKLSLRDSAATLNDKQFDINAEDGALYIGHVSDDETSASPSIIIDDGENVLIPSGRKVHIGAIGTVDSDALVQVKLTSEFENLKIEGPFGASLALHDLGGGVDQKQINMEVSDALLRVRRFDDDFAAYSDLASISMATGDMVLDLGQYSHQSSTALDKVVATMSDEVVEVWQESDFGAVSGTGIPLTDGTSYHIMDVFTLTKSLVVPTGGSVQVRTANRAHSILYTQVGTTEALFRGVNIGTLALFDCVFDGNSTGTLFNIDGGVISSKFPDFNSWADLGTVANLADFFGPGMFFDTASGLTMDGCSSCTIYGHLGIMSGSGSLFYVTGSGSGDLQFYNGILEGDATNSMFNVHGATYPVGQTVNIGGNNIVSGLMFNPSSIIQTDDRIISRGNKGAPDSTATATGTAFDQGGTLSSLTQNIASEITATFTEQDVERFSVSASGVFRHEGSESITAQVWASITGKSSSASATTFNFYLGQAYGLNGIDSFADAGAGNVTATTTIDHSFIAGDRVVIMGTTNYNGDYILISVTADTFTFTATWVATETGWNPRKILPASKASNQLSNAYKNSMLIGQADMAEDDFVQLFVENTGSSADLAVSDINVNIAKV